MALCKEQMQSVRPSNSMLVIGIFDAVVTRGGAVGSSVSLQGGVL
jgi:hypothetical protein